MCKVPEGDAPLALPPWLAQHTDADTAGGGGGGSSLSAALKTSDRAALRKEGVWMNHFDKKESVS